MTNTEILLGFIGFMLVIIWLYIRWIYVRLEYKPIFDTQAPVNQYGENLTDAIQNSIARGHRGLNTWER